MSRILSTSSRLTPLLIILAFSGCAFTGTQVPATRVSPDVEANLTPLSKGVEQFGSLLRAYPGRRPFGLDMPIVVGVDPIQNFSGEEGLPPELSPVLTTILGSIGFPIFAKPSVTLSERGVMFGHYAESGPAPLLRLRGSVSEGEKRITTEYNADMDLLFGGSGKNAVDLGATRGKGYEAWTLSLDLHLVVGGLAVETTSHRVEVVRRSAEGGYGIFFRGSGLGYRFRSQIAQSKSHALRIAAQQSIVVLLGRYFRVPYWRVLANGRADTRLERDYRVALADGHAPEDYRLLLYAHGLEMNLSSYTFTTAELTAVADLKQKYGFARDTKDLDFAMHLWSTVPYDGDSSRLGSIRRHLQAQDEGGFPVTGVLPEDSWAETICRLEPGENLFLPLLFDYELASLSELAKNQIDIVFNALKISCLSDGDWWVDLKGHSDSRGDRTKLQELSEKRAARVQAYLENEHAVPTERIFAEGFGASRPRVDSAQVAEDHAQNRRVEMLLVAGKPGELLALPEGEPSPPSED